jgi:gas vesicle protein
MIEKFDPAFITLVGIFGGIIGSILTVVITKLIDLIQKSKEHKYALGKMFFEKKLNAAEIITTQYQILSNACLNLSIVFERLTQDETESEDYVGNYLFETVNKQLEVANNASLILGNAIGLYFDHESTFSSSEKTKEFYQELGKLQVVSERASNSYTVYAESIGSELEEQANESWGKAEAELESTLKEISNRYKAFNEEINSLLSQIRKEMKRFEY